MPGVDLVDLASLADVLATSEHAADVEATREIVAEEVAAFLGWQRATSVAPTVVALRDMADAVVQAELVRLDGRLPALDPRARAEIEQTVRRVVDKLLHAPTVRVKQLAEEPGGQSYADALRKLFDLDPAAVEAVTRADVEAAAHPGVRHDRPPARHPPQRPGHRAGAAGGRRDHGAHRSRGRARRGHDVRRHQPRGARPDRRHRRLRVRAARRAARGEVDLAVHSLKDLPTAEPAGILLAAVPPREDPRDVLVARDGLTLGELPDGARVGTGSPRRAAQLRALGYGLDVVEVRGNVDTRLRLVDDGEVDAVVLARAGWPGWAASTRSPR